MRDYTQRILRGDRIGLIGPNGSGKTTLLRLLVGELEPDAGTIARGARVQIAYFDQQRAELDPEQSVADSVNDGNDTVIINGEPRHIIGYLADFLFPRERAVSPVKSLSGGERNRLMLARLFARPANVLVLDEPTNDLDIETLELLEELIADFPGTVLLVSHDRAFLDNIVTSTLAFEGDGRVVEYVGGWGDYLRQREQRARSRTAQRLRPERGAKPPRESERGWGPASADKSGPDASRTPDGGPEKRKLSFKEQREFESLPARIEALEEEQRRLTEESESRPTSTSRAAITSAVCSRASSASRRSTRPRWRAGWSSRSGRFRAPSSGPSLERLREQLLDRAAAVVLELPRAGAGEVRVRDHRRVGPATLPVGARPLEPAVLLLIEDEERLVAQLRELRAPARSAAHGPVVEDRADDVDLLAVVDLIPERLQDLPDRRAVGVAPVHQPRHVLEADVAGLQLLVIEHADAAAARLLVTVEGEVHLLDAVAFGAGAELGLGPGSGAAEQNEVGLVHDGMSGR